MAEKTIKFLEIDITQAVIEGHDTTDISLSPSDMFNSAMRTETLTIEDLKKLKKELLANPEKYKDVCPMLPEESGDNKKDMLSLIALRIHEIKNGIDLLY
jgi:hypothetical protein